MSNTHPNEPAFPKISQDLKWKQISSTEGMSLRQYAAIHLKVADSGTYWLDDMILESVRHELVAKAMQAILSNPDYTDEDCRLAAQSYNVADAMIKKGAEGTKEQPA